MGGSAAAPLRLQWIDSAKGLGIILVALGHAIRGVEEAISPSAWQQLAAIDYLIYSFHMSLFLLLSGYVAAVVEDRSGTFRGFLRSKFWSIVYPYLLWSILLACLQAIAASETNLMRIIRSPWTLAQFPVGVMWFLHAMFFCQLVFFLCRFVPGRSGVRLWVALSLIALAAYCTIDFPLQVSVLAQDLYGLTFFSTGVALRRAKVGFAQGAGAGLAWVLLGLAGLATLWFQYQADPAIRHPARLLIGWGVALCVAGLCASWRNNRFLEFLGKRSLAIYLAHTIFAAAVLRLALMASWTLESMLSISVMLLTMTVAGLAGSLLMYRVASRIGLLALLGWAVPQRYRANRPPREQAVAEG